MPSSPVWTILETLKWTTGYFEQRGVDQPRPSAEILLAHSLGVKRIDLYLRHDQPLNPGELAAYKAVIRRRARHEPVAYITGFKGFRHLDLAVGPDVLIPRPETEILVDIALEILPAADRKRWRVMDAGTGSGAILLALATQRPGHFYLGLDRSFGALCQAAANGKATGGRDKEDAPGHRVVSENIFWVKMDWLTALAPRPVFDMIVSNPPYIPRADLDSLMPDVRDFEPRRALDGGPDGMAPARRILHQAVPRLKAGGCLIMEMGSDQGERLRALARRNIGWENIRIRKDDAGHDRVMICGRKA
ncbi:MAG: protein-(glutamine-N5) methyltransferase, release factor-specific [Desulfobacterales bacterium]|nr:MAG: protein-(glutamine-N5) methyltransferase, release factor-specific [Desulfobacterales bacterium]